MYPIKLKLSNITNLSDARYAAAMAIDYMGFCFDTKDENYIPPIKAKEIFEWTSGSLVVAEFGAQSIDEINNISELLNVDAIEINNDILPDEISQFQIPIIKKIDISQYDETSLQRELDAYKNVCFAFHLFESIKATIDNNVLIELCKQYTIIWGLTIDIANTKNIIDAYKPYAINISGGMEEKPGIKDFDELNDWLDTIRIEE